MEKKIIAVFGGSFNPPTISHINLATQILDKMKQVEKIIFVPVSTKYNKQGLASDEDRFSLLEKICSRNKNLEVSSIELDSAIQLYTIETLNIMQNKYPNKDIYFIIGTDNLKELETWHDAENIVKSFKILVLERDNDIMEKIISENVFLQKNKNAFIVLKDIQRIDMSASYIREKIRQRESITGMVPKEIEQDVIKIYTR